MSNYLRNVAHRAAGTSLLRPRVPSRFEPVAGMGPAASHFREVVTEREVEAPRAAQAKETRLPPQSAPVRVSETQPRREESGTPNPALLAHTPEKLAVVPGKTNTDHPPPVQETHTHSDPLTAAILLHNVRPEITQKRADTRVLVSQNVVTENIQPRPAATQPIVQNDTPTDGGAGPQQQFPAPTPERRPERHTPAVKAESQIRARDIPAAPLPVAHTRARRTPN